MHLWRTLAVLALISVGCGSNATTASGADESSHSRVLFDGLLPTPEGYGNAAYVKTGVLVLVDEAGETVSSGNPEYDMFTLRVDAIEERDETVAFHVYIGNAREGFDWQCDSRRGLIRPQPDGQYKFFEDGVPKTDLVGFDSNAMDCGEAPPPHKANELFGDAELTIKADGDILVFTLKNGNKFHFAVRSPI